MTFPTPLCTAVFALSAFATLIASPRASAQSDLRVGEAVERDLAQDDAHAYALDLDAGQFVLGTADQLTVDVVVTVTGPGGETVGAFDGPARGPEPFDFVTETAGVHTVTVTPFQRGEGRYAVRIDRSEPAATTPGGAVDQRFAALDNDRSPGAVVGVVHRGEVVFARAYGMASLTHGAPFTVETPTNIASVSKQFTAYAVALLAERGRLSLDDDVREHLPELPDFGEPVTLRHLLTHTSGYREYLTALSMAAVDIERDYFDRDDVVGVVRRQPALQNAPGAERSYNNTGYALLSLVVERVTGEPFDVWMRENVFGPHGMDRTSARMPWGQIVPGRAEGHVATEGGGWREAADIGATVGDGSVYTTVGDLLRWMDTYRTDGDRGPRRAMTTEYVTTAGDSTGYGLGLSLRTHRGLRTVEHTGADAAHRAVFVYVPEIEAGAVVLTNSPTVPAMADDVLDLFFPDAFPPRPPAPATAARAEGPTDREAATPDVDPAPFDPASFPPADFDAYTGRYELDAYPGIVVAVSREGDRLYSERSGAPRAEVVAVGPATFESRTGDVRLAFDPSDDGGPPRLAYSENRGRPDGATRLPDEPPMAVEDFAGRYVSDELGTLYTVRVADGGLELTHARLDDPVPLQHITGGRFRGGYPLGTLEFERGADGAVAGFVAGSGAVRGVRFDRVDGGPGRAAPGVRAH